MTKVATAGLSFIKTTALKRIAAVVAGAVLVGLSAQLAVPLPGTPVPVTMQVAAVLVVGGLLGPVLGAASLACYLMLGAAGVPVFAPVGAPLAAHLLGPTGGYLLAYPLAAAMAGLATAGNAKLPQIVGGMAVAALIIHAGGVAQLAILTGNLSRAIAVGSVPFLIGDGLKTVVAALIVWRLAPLTRALR